MSSDDAKSLYDRGNSQKREGDLDGAIESYEQAINIHPDYAEAYSNLGNVQKQKGEIDTAIESYKQAINCDPSLFVAFYNLGNAFQLKNDLENAALSFQKALELKPDFSEAHINLGNIQQMRGEETSAIKSFESALKIKPDSIQANFNLGNLLLQQGNNASAMECFNNTLELKPDFVEALVAIGLALVNVGKLDEAIETYEKAIRLQPDHAEAHYNLGLTFEKNKAPEKATKSYEHAIAVNPNFAEAYNNLGNLMHYAGHFSAAMENFQNALKIKPHFVEALSNMGNALQEEGHSESSTDCYMKALSIEPNYAEAAWLLSGTAKTIPDAKKWLSRCLDSNENHLKAKLTLAALSWYEGDCSALESIKQSKLKTHPFTRSIEWIESLPKLPDLYFSRWQFFDEIILQTDVSRPFYEFGVWKGRSFKYLAKFIKRGFGFDTFQGLPENWHDEKIGSYSAHGKIPQVDGGEFIMGEFKDTLPKFFSKTRPTASLINYDADLYSATICALEFSKSVIDSDTILIFDEFLINAHWELDEIRALDHFCNANNLSYKVLAISLFTKQVALKLIGLN